ncbi:MAG: phosphatidylserine decarboxylase [Woeseia sp.]|nr:phosphatidylserine decarboxylase [Woeseia sp.]MBT8095542.1 phosphatidylserine decarboxylase [Woeseia sp.]NNE59850.1 phosphatidylserine decarboxylase [Woeseia sp.]NNL55867.1 phosphatidylserine decarboxylase [Woeseia sp.]
MNGLKARLFVGLQYLLPRYWMTSAVYRISRVRQKHIKNLLINKFIRLFNVDVSDAAGEVPADYLTFNDFFTRELASGARVVDSSNLAVVSPVDGTVSAAGAISEGMLIQAKGHRYSLQDLLATDLDECANFDGGHFITVYLAPDNYHRVHAPLAGHLNAARYVPGDLFSVNAATVSHVPGLFARNERLVCHLTTDIGPLAVLLVGALNVGSITTPWTGEIRPRANGMVEELNLKTAPATRALAKGDLLGWFNMGSTVIVLLPRGAAALDQHLVAGAPVRMGQSLATLRSIAP